MSASFSQIIGHSQIISSLQNSILSQKTSHAYIFTGEAGAGKKSLANGFAKTLQCEVGGADACGRCISCQTFESGNHPDVFHVTPSGKSLGVDDVRDKIIKKMETKPYRYPYKIFIIEQAHTMTVQAQNALLKTIEEPAGYGVFLLLAEGVGMFLPTVLSRCIVHKLKPISERDVFSYLLRQNIGEDVAKLASVYAQGNIGRAVALSADQEFIELRQQVIEILSRANNCNLVQAFALAKEFDAFKEKENIQVVLDIMYLWYRDVAVLQAVGSSERVIQQDRARAITEASVGQTLGRTLRKLDAVWQAKWQMKQHGNFQLIIEIMLLELCGQTKPSNQRSSVW